MNTEDEKIFEQLFKANYAAIRYYILSHHNIDHHTAEDVVSQAFIILSQKWDTISPHESAVLLSWLYSTVNHIALDVIKKQSRSVSIDPTPISDLELSDHGAHVEEIEQAYDYRILLQRIKQTLPDRDWLLFYAIYIEKRPTEDILERFDLTPNALYLRKARIKKKLKIFKKYFENRDRFDD